MRRVLPWPLMAIALFIVAYLAVVAVGATRHRLSLTAQPEPTEHPQYAEVIGPPIICTRRAHSTEMDCR
jgi:hypothetical protein